MSKRPLLTILLLLSVFCCFASSPDYSRQWQKGNDLYGKKQYDSALVYFEEIASKKPRNAEVYYNLGNTYYRLNKVAPAILNYERALRIKPDYKEAKENLAITQGRISNKIPEAGDIFFVNWWQSWTHPNTATPWAVAALVCFLAFIGLMAYKRFSKSTLSLPGQVAGLLVFVSLCLLGMALAAASNVNKMDKAVVMQADAPMMNAEQRGKPLALVPEGTTVKVRGERGAWLEIGLPDGRSGWMQQDLVTRF